MMNRRPPFAMAVVVLAAISSSSGHVAAQSSLAPPNWDEGVRLAEASDRNPDPDVVELDITAKLADVRIGATVVKAWTYNGGIPGPFIRAKVGDRLIVHFTNELAEPTTIHWHGVRVPIQMDGVPGISQAEVKAGERFTYDFVLKDAGLYWYHPHVMSAAQVGYGLYGALLIEDAGDGVGVADALTLVLSDIGFDSRGVLEPADSGGSAGTVFGREGATVLVNGKSNPRLLARAGAPQRWRIVNTAKSRYFLLDLDGQPFTVVGSDGGLQETAQPKEQLLVTPGERFDVIVAPTGAPGSELVLRSMLYNRGYGSVEFRSVETMMTIAFSAEAALPKPTTRVAPRTVTPPPLSGATPVELTFTLPPVDAKGHSEFRVNGVPFWKATPFRSALGETQLWVMKNDTQWDHPFHLHGFFFMPVDEKLLPLHPMVWKDTINVPMKTTVRFLVTFDERPGTWMFHCHILDHAESGLMGSVHVGDGEPAVHSTHPQL